MMGYGGIGGIGLWGGMGAAGGVFMLLFWLALVLLVVWAVRSLVPGGREGERQASVETLKRRYAAGEIDQAEYKQARRALG